MSPLQGISLFFEDSTSGALLVAAGLAFAASFPVHFLTCRFRGAKGFFQNSVLMGFAFALFFAIALNALISIGFVGMTIFSFFFMGIWCSYLIFLVNLLNSFSLRILREILDSPTKMLSKEEIDALFPDRSAFSARLRAMESGGILKINGDEIVLLNKGERLARAILRIRRFFSLSRIG